jgi:hypothetical protein
MQALALKLAFETAIIMTHRPLFPFRSARISPPRMEQAGIAAEPYNPYKSSIDSCRISALNTAMMGSYSAFNEALDTYAASFIGIHVFTAGVVLCLIASFEPMTSQALEAKIGMQELIAMQQKLRGRSSIAAQGLKILEKVVALVVKRSCKKSWAAKDLMARAHGAKKSRCPMPAKRNPGQIREMIRMHQA